MHSASGITAAASMSGIGDSIDHGDENSAVKNTAPDRRTTRSTSDSTSISPSRHQQSVRRGNGQGLQSPNQRVKQIRRFGQEAESLGHRRAASLVSESTRDKELTPRETRRKTMPLLTPDPTFYPSPTMAMQSPTESFAYVALINGLSDGRADALGVVDLDPQSTSYGRLVGQTDMPHAGDELHHFGWNACSSCLCPYAPHPHMERRYLVVPGIHSSRIHILDTKPDPRHPQIVKVIEPETVARRTGYAAPHTVHCGPDGIYVSALGAPDGNGPGGTFIIDPETFDVRGRWELDRGPQHLAYDIWWHLGQDTMISSTWGTPNMVKDGVNPELLLGGKYGNKLHVWDLRRRRHVQELALGDEQQMALELRPAHDPTRAYGFVGVVTSLKDLSSSVFLWYRDPKGNGASGGWAIKKVIEIPAEPADLENLPPLLRGFKVAAPLVTDINLSVDD